MKLRHIFSARNSCTVAAPFRRRFAAAQLSPPAAAFASFSLMLVSLHFLFCFLIASSFSLLRH